MTVEISETAAAAALIGLRSVLEADGPDAPNLTIWSGIMPAAEDDVDPDDNLLLVEFSLIGTSFGDPVREEDTMVADILPIGGVLGAAEGQASFFRLYDRNGGIVMQGSVGLEGSGEVLIIDDVDVTEQKLVTVQSLRLILPMIGA